MVLLIKNKSLPFVHIRALTMCPNNNYVCSFEWIVAIMKLFGILRSCTYAQHTVIVGGVYTSRLPERFPTQTQSNSISV